MPSLGNPRYKAVVKTASGQEYDLYKSKFVERFPEFSLFYRLFSPLDSEMICIFPYFYPCEESAREIREIFI
jgi:hypothetical protein